MRYNIIQRRDDVKFSTDRPFDDLVQQYLTHLEDDSVFEKYEIVRKTDYILRCRISTSSGEYVVRMLKGRNSTIMLVPPNIKTPTERWLQSIDEIVFE